MAKKVLVIVLSLLFLTSLSVFGAKKPRPQNSAVQTVKTQYQPAPDEDVRYVPDELVVNLQDNVTKKVKISPKVVNGIVQTGIQEFDALNQKFLVYEMEAEFPGVKVEPGIPDLTRYYILRFNGQFKLEEVLAAYSQLSSVEHVEPIGIHPLYINYPNDNYFGPDGHPDLPDYQWYHNIASDNDMDTPEGWVFARGDSNVIVAILDGGVRYYHRDLGGPWADWDPKLSIYGNVWINWAEYNGVDTIDDDFNGYLNDWVGWDFVNNIAPSSPCSGEDYMIPDNDPRDYGGHGTHVAGLIGAITNNAQGVAGIAGGWGDSTDYCFGNGVKIMCLRIGWTEGCPLENGYVRMDFAAQALTYAANKGAKIANASWGSSNTGGLESAVNYFLSKGGLIVHAAGNSSKNKPDYLASRTEVMTVAATDSFDQKAIFSNYGEWVDVSAPGVDIISLYHNHQNPGGDYVKVMSGTSMSSPLVAGLVALIKSQDTSRTRQQIFDKIISTTDSIDDHNPGYKGLLGSGRINVRNALDYHPSSPWISYKPAVMTKPIRWAKNGASATDSMKFDNVGAVTLEVRFSGPSWLTISPTSFNIPKAGPTQRVNLTFNGGAYADTFLTGRLKILSNSGVVGGGLNFNDTQYVDINFVVTDTFYYAEFDTCKRGPVLVVSNVGNIGAESDSAGMFYRGLNYLFEGSGVMVTNQIPGFGSDTVGFSWIHAKEDFLPARHLIKTDYPNLKTTVWIDKFALLNWRIPNTNPTHWAWFGWTKWSKIIQFDWVPGRLHAVVIKNWWVPSLPPKWWMDVSSTAPTGGYFGIAGDWDVAGDFWDKDQGGIIDSLNLVYLRQDAVPNNKYYGGYQFLGAYVKKGATSTNYTIPFAMHVGNNATQMYPFGGYNDDSLWKYMSTPGDFIEQDLAQDMNVIISAVEMLNPDYTTEIGITYTAIVSDSHLVDFVRQANALKKEFIKYPSDMVYHLAYGDANADARVTVSDVVHLVNFLFKGGPEPWLLLSDCNRDDKVTVSDVVLLVNYLFKGSIAPLEPNAFMKPF